MRALRRPQWVTDGALAVHVKVDELRVGFAPRIGGSTAFSFVKRRLAEPVEYNLLAGGLESARQLFTLTRERLLTSPGRDEWLEVNPAFSLQPHCNRAGINIRGGAGALLPRVRVGILGNDDDDCASTDSFIGVGAVGDNTNVAGNRVFPVGASDRSIPLFGALLVRPENCEPRSGCAQRPRGRRARVTAPASSSRPRRR